MDPVLLDTDILSEVLKRHDPNVTRRASRYLHAHGKFAFSAFTWFEITRGYREKGASSLLVRFEAFCGHSIVVPLTQPIFDRAATLWAVGRSGGRPLGDADLLIAATALEEGRVLVTGNTQHFSWIPGMRLEDWRSP